MATNVCLLSFSIRSAVGPEDLADKASVGLVKATLYDASHYARPHCIVCIQHIMNNKLETCNLAW